MSNVPPKDWDPPEHLSLSEREFLVDRAETINGIIAASYLQVGQVLLQVKKKFKRDPDLDGWFGKWLTDCTPISKERGYKLAQIAEEASDDPVVATLATQVKESKLLLALRLPTRYKEEVLALFEEGEDMTTAKLEDIRSQPEVQLSKLLESVQSLENQILEQELEQLTAPTDISRQKLWQSKQRLGKALSKLKEKEEEVESLGKERSTQDVILQTLRKQLKQKEVVIENMSLDPEQKRKRALAQTVVDATKGLDLLLSSIDRYGTDKPELGLEAINTIERKMDEVKSKLLEHYADLSETGGSS